MVHLKLEEVMELKAGENRHLDASLLAAVDMDGISVKNIYSPEFDLGVKARKKGWTNIGDISACLRTYFKLGQFYKDSETPYIAVASKHTKPVIIAKARTQKGAAIRAIAGDLNSPFGGFWGFNTPIEYGTAEFLDRVFLEGIIAPGFERGTAELLKDTSEVKAHKNRFLIETGEITQKEIDPLGYSLQPVACAKSIKQQREAPFYVGKEAVVVTGNNGNTDINSLDDAILNDIEFAGNAAIYLASNLVFFVHDGAIAGLGDGCGARVVAARKARNMLEDSVYAALSENTNEKWDAVLYDAPFTKEDFDIIKTPIKLTAFSDAFYPKLDGFVETAGIDRINGNFGLRQVLYQVKDGKKRFIPKRNNFNSFYNDALLPEVIVQPGGSLGDKVVLPIAEKYNIKMVFTMTPEIFKNYKEVGPGKGISGRRFFGHIIM